MLGALGVLGVFGQTGCGTTYAPRLDGRVALVIHHGAALYVKDGRQVPVGPFSGELPGLVAGEPVAAEHARSAHRQIVAGEPAYLIGAAGVVVGVVALSGPAGWVAIAVGGALAGTCLLYTSPSPRDCS